MSHEESDIITLVGEEMYKEIKKEETHFGNQMNIHQGGQNDDENTDKIKVVVSGS